MRKLLLSMLLCILAVVFISCNQPAVEISIEDAKVEIGVGETHEFNYSVVNAVATATYEVADTSVLAIDANVVKGLKEGSTTVKVKVVANDKNATTKEATITVNVVEKRTVAVSFSSQVEGFAKKAENAKYGATYKLPEAPAIEGYKFLGWAMSEEATEYVTELANITTDQAVVAKYEVLVYKVTYVVNGEETSADLAYGTKVELQAKEVKGYDFLGWTLAETGTDYVSEIVVKGDMKVYAQLEVKKVAISYELNGGSCDGLVKELVMGSELDLSKLNPTKEHYSFLGWTTQPDSTSYVTGVRTVNADVTYYAQFEIDAFAISYDLDGGTLYSRVSSVDYGKDLTLPTPVKAGSNFLGWSLEKGGTTYVTKLDKVEKDVTVYANWSYITYTLSYVLNDGVLSGQKESITAAETYTLPTPTKDGFTFLGWSTSEYSTVFVAELKNTSANMTLYAHYTDGLVATPETIEQVLADASEGAKITLLSGVYANALKISKKVTLSGPNAGIDPVHEERGAEARFTGLVTIAANNVVIDGIELYNKGELLINNADDVVIKNVLITDSNVVNGTAGNIAPLSGITCKNLTITSCKMLKPVTNKNIKLMAFYGFNIDGLTITYCSFTSTASMSTYPDGIRIEQSNTYGTTDKFSYGIKGNVEIAHNYFEGFCQYSIWFRNYKEGTYNIIDNELLGAGRGDEGYFCPLIRIDTYAGTGKSTMNVKYNKLTDSDGLVRLNGTNAITSNVELHVNYNIVINRLHTYDFVNNTSVQFDAENNYGSKGILAKGVTITNSYATEEEVPTYAGDNSQTYNITYTLNEGKWKNSYYTAAEIGADFCTDYGHGMKYTTFDTSYTESLYLTEMLADATIKAKWMWLLQGIYDVAGNKDTALDPTTADFSTGKVKGFYFCNLFGFFNTCAHHESNFGTDSYDFSDPETGKAICALGPAKGEDAGEATYKTNVVTELAVPSKDGYAFLGWKTQEGKIIKAIPASMTGDLALTAVWEKAVIADGVIITNMPEKGIKLYETLQLEWSVTPSNAYNKNVIFYAVDSNIFSITEGGLIKAKSVGTGKLRIKLEGNPEYELYVDIVVWSGDYFDVSYETESYVNIDEAIKLNAAYIDSNGKVKKVEWKSLTETIATVDENGMVSAKAEGLATIRATVIGQSDLYFDFYVTVLPADMEDAMKFVVDNHNSNALTVYNLGIGAGTPAYYYDLVASVNHYFFNNELQIDRRYYDQLPEGTKNNGVMSSVEFITVHYTGNMNKGADADNNCDYFNNLSYAASIHYVTGRTNLTDLTGLSTGYSKDAYLAFAGLSEKYAGWHGSDSSQGPTKWLATGIKVAEGDPETPVISVENGKFTFNGKATTIAIPQRSDGIEVTGPTFVYNGTTCDTINKMGLAWKVVEGEYYMGNTYWGSQAYGMAICSIGANYNSIGIESCVDIGSDLEHTWHVTAQLVADIMVRYNLDISRVVGHHFFSGKTCPQPMLENDMQLWYEFIEMVEAEYAKLTTYKDATISAKAVNSDGILRDNGLLVQDNQAHCVTYEVTVNGKKITLATCVESYYKCNCQRTEESLQIQGYEII